MQAKMNFEHPKTGGHFGKNNGKLLVDLKCREMQTKMNFGHKMAAGCHFEMAASGYFEKKKCFVRLSEMARKAKMISDLQNGHQWPF